MKCGNWEVCNVLEYMFNEISCVVRVRGDGRSWHPACTLSCLPRMVMLVLIQGESWEPDDFQN